MKYKSLSTVIREINEKKEPTSQYLSLLNAIRSIYNRQLIAQKDQPNDEELKKIQNRKVQYIKKIL